MGGCARTRAWTNPTWTPIPPACCPRTRFGRPWREGLANVAVGLAGLQPLRSYLGKRDPAGHVLQATILALADEVAGAAEPVMGKLSRIPVAIVRGLDWESGDGSSRELLRDPTRDLFR